MRDAVKNIVKVRVVVVLPAKVARACCVYAKKAGRAGKAILMVDNKNYLPHITLCRVEVEKESVEKIQKELEALLLKEKAFNITSKGLVVVNDGKNTSPEDDHYVFIDFKKATMLQGLRRKVFSKLKKYNRREAFEELTNFRPHITLAIFKNLATATRARNYLSYKPFDFPVLAVALTNSIQFGQVSKVIKKYKLES